MTDRLCIASNGTEKFEFSAQDLLACCTDCGNGCRGGYSSRAWKYWVINGIVSGGDFNSSYVSSAKILHFLLKFLVGLPTILNPRF